MGPGGIIVLILLAAVVGYILAVERPFQKETSGPGDDSAGSIPAAPRILEPAPQDMVERLTPPWQAEFVQKLQTEGYSVLGNYSYSSTDFFWARILLSPDQKSVFLLVNWLEGKKVAKQVISNVEIYSFDKGGGFLLTACAQDGATRLLTGAARPPEDRLSLHLKAVFAESAVRPLMAEHRKRMGEREEKGLRFKELLPAEVLSSLSNVFSYSSPEIPFKVVTQFEDVPPL